MTVRRRRVWGKFLPVMIFGVGCSATGVLMLTDANVTGLPLLLFGLALLFGLPVLVAPSKPHPLWRLATMVMFGSCGLAIAVLAPGTERYPRWLLAFAGVVMSVVFYGNAVALIARLVREPRR